MDEKKRGGGPKKGKGGISMTMERVRQSVKRDTQGRIEKYPPKNDENEISRRGAKRGSDAWGARDG